jgi:hypothetical protein
VYAYKLTFLAPGTGNTGEQIVVAQTVLDALATFDVQTKAINPVVASVVQLADKPAMLQEKK